MANNLLSVADFNTLLDQFAGRTVGHLVVTKTLSNISGQDTLSYAASADIKAYFMETGRNWDYNEAGFIEQGDAVLFAKIANAVKKDDKIRVANKEYVVKEALDVPGVFDSSTTATKVYTACNLALIGTY